MNTRRENFRKYLETGGAIESLTSAIVNLYEQPEPPADPLNFLRQQLGASDGIDVDALVRQNQELKAKVASLNQTIAELEAKLNTTEQP
ncbi:hypothetical protein TVAG_064160 [Trichomonas vaginalis G3]|uniref:c-Myc-binding protein n=1 Tax=Trichomonas vaginalis (strain ATCC PRA-98 / G3) TaxID=412133 RepID=A2FBX6_TRIV3|nr:associate of C-MYC AMY-1 family [Trichomonas vaginalis G3]EAX97575.1 hypothetical protein TVAG_064160 [Trichomonas vaginalis G3]KAI5516224.1 associate of C-MYC AMY-1 family [Trichomonas vaginalis G3]|eukprot:XP_001310505.1 hypothetical protein [Trichomonas vaginalis G3]